MSVAGAGEPIARGRDAEVYALGDERGLRRYRGPGPTGREMRVMAWARSHGYPVPQVYGRTETDLVLDRLDGPTMLGDLARRPWRLVCHARTLAGLHRQLHAIPAPAELPAPLGEGGSLVHLDRHPGNVMLRAWGPMVIDWPTPPAVPRWPMGRHLGAPDHLAGGRGHGRGGSCWPAGGGGSWRCSWLACPPRRRWAAAGGGAGTACRPLCA